MPRWVYGLIANAIERCPSTWSGPSCAPSPTAKIAVDAQNGDSETAWNRASRGLLISRNAGSTLRIAGMRAAVQLIRR